MTIQKNIKLFASSLVLLSSSLLAGEFSCESIYGNFSCSDGNENYKYIFTANAEKNNVAMLQYDSEKNLLDKQDLKNCNVINEKNWSCELHIKGRKIHKTQSRKLNKLVINMSEGNQLTTNYR